MNKKVVCNGQNISLTDRNYVTAGGEGEVYNVKGTIYKIYHKPIDGKKEQKLKYLSILKKDNIIAPKDIVYSVSGEPIGYTMKYIDNSSSLALLFTSTFKKRNGITDKNIENIFMKMSETIGYIHSNDILIVDGNELNYLISNSDWETPYFIDVDSYQTKDFPATVIMPSIRDFCSPVFNKNTDWYSFGVLMFQLYTGIHPYKGTHPKYNITVDSSGNESKIDNVGERCKNKISVYNKDVKYPPFVKFDNIPSSLNDWFIAMFERGERLPPPNVIINLAPKPQVTKIYGVGLSETLIKEYDSKIQRVLFVNGQLLIITENNYHFGMLQVVKNYKREVPIIFDNNGNAEVYHVSKEGTEIFVYHNKQEERITVPELLKVSLINNRLFALAGDQLIEYEINSYTKKFSPRSSWGVMTSSSTFFSGCMYCNSYGKALFYLPEIKDNNKVLHIVQIEELKDHKIMDAYYEAGTLISISKFNSNYVKTVIKLDDFFVKYSYIQNACDLQEINATVLSNGMSIILDSDNLEMSAKYKVDRKIVSVVTDMIFTHRGNEVLGYKDKELYSLSLTK